MAATPGASGAPRRLIITSMTLENFKSYAGAQHIGPFHKARRRSPAGAAVRVARCLQQGLLLQGTLS